MNRRLEMLVVSLVVAVLLAGCDGRDGEAQFARSAIQAEQRARQAQLEGSRARQELTRTDAELKRVTAKLSASEEQARRLAEQLAAERSERLGQQAQTRAAEWDLYVATAICFACVVAILLFLHMLMRELGARKALAAFLRRIKGGRQNGRGHP